MRGRSPWRSPVNEANPRAKEGRLSADKAFAFQGDLANQLQRAALSICNNVAEGFERGTTKELLTLLYYARGSAGEVRSMLLLAERLPRFDHLKSETSNLKSQI